MIGREMGDGGRLTRLPVLDAPPVWPSLPWLGGGAVLGAAIGIVATWSLAWWIVVAWAAVAGVGGVAAVVDVATARIPNVLTLAGIAVVAVAAIIGSIDVGPHVVGNVAVGIAVGAALFVVLMLVGEMGGGDVKLAGVLGGAAGLASIGTATAATFGMCAAITVGGAAAMARRGRLATVRLGPALVIGSGIGVFVWRRGVLGT